MESGLDLAYNEDQEAIRVAIDRFCNQHDLADIARQSGAPFPRELWLQLADLGAFYPAAPGYTEAGGALEVCAISEMLGQHVFPGPIAATYLAIQVLDADDAAPVIDGRALVSLSSAGSTLLPWGSAADLFLTVDASNIARAFAPDRIEPVPTLGGETWGRAALRIDSLLTNATRGLILANISAAAYLASAGWQLVKEASAHAATRRQFGKPLGDFQAVSHPLADCAIGITAAQTLARAAACNVDRAEDSDNKDLLQAQCLAAAALCSARRASLNAAYACHQVFAGIGVTLEGPAFHISRRIRQLASTPPVGAGEQELLLAAAGLGA
ncbi:MAG TPA: acyl-CoA dehydrogenase family protein [Halioglobus sp.]